MHEQIIQQMQISHDFWNRFYDFITTEAHMCIEMTDLSK